jgi:amidase
MMKKLSAIFVFLVLSTVSHLAIADNKFVLEDATISSIHTAIQKHQLTCEQLVTAYIDRIKKYNLSVNKKAPINAIAEINPNVLEQARTLDQEFVKGQMNKPLFCIPVLLKDNIDSYDSSSASGSISLLGNQPVRDAFLTKKLRDAGAIIFGKGTMDEFAAGMSGTSGLNGRTGNVYDTSKNSGGSSSGSAAAVSANFVMIGIGTDNSGSVRIPAAFNGIFGLRPSTGLISQRGIFPRGNLDGVAGPLTRSAEDLAIVLDVIAQPDSQDQKTLNISRPKTYTSYLDQTSFKNKRIGVVQKLGKFKAYQDMPRDSQQVFQGALKKIKAIIPDINLSSFNLNRKFNEAGEREDIDAYLASYPAARKNFRDICESGRTQVFGTNKQCLLFIKKLPKKYGVQYNQVLNVFKKNKTYVEGVMDKNHLDALFIPVSTTGSTTYDSRALVNESLASNAGLPGIAMNIGYTSKDKMPIGAELISRQYSEGILIGLAYAYEKNTSPRVLPQMPEVNAALEPLDVREYNNLLKQ